MEHTPEYRSIKMLTLFTCFAIVPTVILPPLLQARGWINANYVLQSLTTTGYVLVFLLIKNQRPFIAKWLFFIISIISILVSQKVYFEKHCMVHYLYLSFPLAAPFIFHGNEIKSRIIFSSIPLVMFIGFDWFAQDSLFKLISSQSMPLLLGTFICFASLLGGIYMFSHSSRKYEDAQQRLIDELQRKNAEIKTLRGFLPICCSCKKIRDDSGYWQQIEKYIRAHSEVSFSHGICPECCEALYGNEDWYKEIKKKEELE